MFLLRYKTLRFVREVENYDHRENTLFLREMAPILRNFGRSIVSMGIHLTQELRNQSSYVVEMILEYCGKSLIALSLGRVNFTSKIILKMQLLLSRLQELKLINCCLESESDESRMFSFCSELHTLSIRNVDQVVFIAPVTFPKLHKLQIVFFNFPNGTIEPFFALNPQIKETKICTGYVITNKIIRSIAEYIPQVEKISLIGISRNASTFVEDAKHLKRLTALKLLHIEYEGGILPVLKDLAVRLECLRLAGSHLNTELVLEISKWKQLKKLELPYGDIKLSDILIIVRNLSELTKLNLSSTSMSMTDMVEIVRCALKLRKLRYYFGLKKSFPIDDVVQNLYKKIRDVVARRKEKIPLVLCAYDSQQSLYHAELLNADINILSIADEIIY